MPRLTGAARGLLYALLLSAAGAVVKLYGGARYGSLAVLVDGITCIANLAAGLFLLYTLLASERPADIDHPYGHERYVYTGILGLIVAYSFSLGLSVGLLILSPPGGRSVGEESALYAGLGGLLYGAAILAASRVGLAGASYAGFTASEVLESAVSIGGSLLGARVSSVYDYIGAVIITGFIVVELYENGHKLHLAITDWANPRIVERVRRAFETRGLRVVAARIRIHSGDRYIGEVEVQPAPGMPRDVAELLAEETRYNLEREGIRLTVVIRSPGEPGKT